MLQREGVKVEKIPYDSDQIMSPIGSGDGDFALVTSQVALTGWEGGRADVTFVSGKRVTPPWNNDPNVVSSIEYGLPPTIQFGSIFGYVVPKETPKTHVDWLFKLFKAGASTDGYKQREKLIPATTLGIMDNAEAMAVQQATADAFDPVVRSLGMHWEQLKKK